MQEKFAQPLFSIEVYILDLTKAGRGRQSREESQNRVSRLNTVRENRRGIFRGVEKFPKNGPLQNLYFFDGQNIFLKETGRSKTQR